MTGMLDVEHALRSLMPRHGFHEFAMPGFSAWRRHPVGGGLQTAHFFVADGSLLFDLRLSGGVEVQRWSIPLDGCSAPETVGEFAEVFLPLFLLDGTAVRVAVEALASPRYCPERSSR